MILTICAASLGLMVGGPFGAIVGGVIPFAVSRIRATRVKPPATRLVLLLLLVELRSGLSVLASLQHVSASLPAHADLRRVSRVATVSGLTASISHSGPDLRPVVSQLARSQRSGGSLSSTVRHLLERDLAEERTRRLAKARALPVRLMLPVTLLMLPGLVLMLYAPSLIGLFDELTGAWS
jgi:pilus assembly protein TadC